MSETKQQLAERVGHAEQCLFESIVGTMRERDEIAVEHGEFHQSVIYREGLIGGYIGALFFLTHETHESIKERAEQKARGHQAVPA